ncbi:hypothetical protein SAMN04487898_117141 [Pedobacter sp. ok626]|uniref:hypothetical protein n=1 Tax=Pedobacter sp. ok626 TaxID=1761882 RepID=UPI00088C499B|nr:hypothetical protein [Pedobacter sp. ok626]SDL35052.1 hypothetical protein SAMN04487898_117141 [Pedobacter sp. ok626]
MNATTRQTVHWGQKYRGPNPGITALIYAILFMASLIVFPLLSNGSGFPSPFADIGKIQQLLRDFPGALKTNAFLQFGAAIPLGLFTAAVVTKIKTMGVNAAGLNIALFGGITASLWVSISSLFSWVLCQQGIADEPGIINVLRLLGFATGGIAHLLPLGLLMAGISVPCLLLKYCPAWIAWLGLVLAVLAELSIFGLIFQQAFILLPIVRFGSYIWMIAIGFALMKTNAEKS